MSEHTEATTDEVVTMKQAIRDGNTEAAQSIINRAILVRLKRANMPTNDHREAAAEVSRLHLLIAKLSAEKQRAVSEARMWETRAKITGDNSGRSKNSQGAPVSESYELRYEGELFPIALHLDGDTTTEPPNVHVISGTWKTWRLDPGFLTNTPVRVLKSVSPSNPAAEHPAGNLSYAASTPTGHLLMADDNGRLERASMGYLVLQKILDA